MLYRDSGSPLASSPLRTYALCRERGISCRNRASNRYGPTAILVGAQFFTSGLRRILLLRIRRSLGARRFDLDIGGNVPLVSPAGKQ